jgi:hypothetical protein
MSLTASGAARRGAAAGASAIIAMVTATRSI